MYLQLKWLITKSILITLLSGICTPLLAQEWKEEESKDGNVEVKSRITQSPETGIPVIEYVATAHTQTTVARCVAAIKDFSNHTGFFEDTSVTKKIKDISKNEWLLYYYVDAPWPVPDNDCITRLKLLENTTQNGATFTGTAAPGEYEMKDVKRMTINEIIYHFKAGQNNSITITITGKFSPVVDVPHWLMNTWAPEGPAKIVEGIIRLASE